MQEEDIAALPVGRGRVCPNVKEVYVTCEEDNEVFAVNTSTFAASGRMKVGPRPRAVVFTADGKTAFVTSENGASVDVIDTATHKTAGSVSIPTTPGTPTPPRPMGAVMAPDGRELYVSLGRAKSIAVIDPASRKFVRSIEDVGARPWGIGISPDGKKLYTANGPSGRRLRDRYRVRQGRQTHRCWRKPVGHCRREPTIDMSVTFALLIVLLSAPQAEGQNTATPPHSVAGIVRDPSGSVLPGASIVVRTASGAEERTTSGADGHFVARVTGSGDLLLIVRAEGFGEHRQTVSNGVAAENVDCSTPATLSETVTVTAARTEQLTRNVAASVNLVDRDTIARLPAVVADDVLRQVPTFSLFRRTSSLAAHPTTQGVSLRGVGPSGVVARWRRWTAFLSTTRSAAGRIGHACRWQRGRIEIVDNSSSSAYGTTRWAGLRHRIRSPSAAR